MVPIKKMLTWLGRMKARWFSIIIPAIFLGVLFFLATFNNVYTETYDIERFAIAKETIRSPITVENKSETERKMRETIASVEDRYTISTEVTKERIAYVEEIFDAITKLEDEQNENPEELNEETDVIQLTALEKVERLKQILSDEITKSVNEGAFFQLVEASPKERQEGERVFKRILSDTLANGVRAQNIKTTANDVKQHLNYSNLSSGMIQALSEISNFAVTENAFYDVEKTMQAEKEAASSVEPEVIRAGEIIVREGQRITNETYEELQLVGLLNKDRNVFPLIGLILLLLLILTVLIYEMNGLDQKDRLDRGTVITVLLVSLITIGLMKVVSLFTTEVNQLFYVVPIATGVLLVKQLIQERLAIVLAIMYAVIGSVIFNAEIPGSLNFEAGIYFLFSQLGAIIFLMNVKDRLSIMRAGIGMAFINVVTIMLFVFLSFEKYAWSDLIFQSGYGIASAFLSAVLTLGLMPFFETSLGILSDIKLLSLSNPNHPLLRKILMEAPGTYHHSVMVANLSEAACEAIGANGLLARVGAYYHDIGKTVRPHFFIENQIGMANPHDRMDPRESADIIISHPYDGADMLKQHKMPKEIIAIANEHHGTSLLKYFYYKEKETAVHVEESAFRYPGPKPKTKEAAIVCICDSVEAAVRSMSEPTEEKIEQLVSSIIDDRLMDGQLDDCSLTMRDLNTIEQAICETLKGIFHSRIQYPVEEVK
ncbi:HD family phosphohydrolase [Lentibacillus saliphilus]|uniref:HD family phosphohydrolase n=1 Tax=Lentibacillus saliphilus TaxID=2737028 RepID=UPI001C2FAD0F|nr:HD family phosphohydrolase [Lentibacillus saliphilus]